MKRGYIPVVINAEYKGGYLIEVEFDNGERAMVPRANVEMIEG